MHFLFILWAPGSRCGNVTPAHLAGRGALSFERTNLSWAVLSLNYAFFKRCFFFESGFKRMQISVLSLISRSLGVSGEFHFCIDLIVPVSPQNGWCQIS